MQLTELTLSNLNLYSPSTGEVICHEDSGYNEDAISLMGYWIQEIADQPFIKNPTLKKEWEAFFTRFETEHDIFPSGEDDLDNFFKQYNNPDWLVLKVKTFGMPGDTAWFIVNMEPHN
ncbi:hypothetical protein [Marinilabilia salmonicolor]|jgi:hypothetical protein|uniref:Uncharacterized protein n=1 Tax=Marinilabilia salmonicolor TaxID=989 RepID=A0A368V6M0_9BACT|nr:hypothetical protein [Marinilabilia salmonicolor]RCW36758.1 hypothetical protein DFO77_10749 [Marinilabilia salmonicolor]